MHRLVYRTQQRLSTSVSQKIDNIHDGINKVSSITNRVGLLWDYDGGVILCASFVNCQKGDLGCQHTQYIPLFTPLQHLLLLLPPYLGEKPQY